MDVEKNEHLPVKKFVLFLGTNYDGMGAMYDIFGSYDTVEEIDAILKQKLVRRNYDWYQIVERDTWAILRAGDVK